MTMKEGFLGGLAIGVVIYLFYAGILVTSIAPTFIKGLFTILAVGLSILSVALGGAQAINGHASDLGTTGDGLVYGITTFFSIAYFVTSFLSGNLPLPF
jgi:hypothetical protein